MSGATENVDSNRDECQAHVAAEMWLLREHKFKNDETMAPIFCIEQL
jgi:hypothetical protein